MEKIAIARCFIRNADIYILDEPSSFLDAKSECEVFDSFRRHAKDKIGIFISHRLSSAKYADKIIVLDNGEIVEQGTHDELLQKNDFYSQLYNIQQSNYQ